MDYDEMIQSIFGEAFLFPRDCYYHAFYYQQQEFLSMLTDGIKSPFLLGKKGNGNNGKFYVSLSKNEECEMSAFDQLSENPMFVIQKNIKVVKAKNFKRVGHSLFCFTQTPFPIRECEYDNEYQKFMRVSPKDIVAIQFNLMSIYQHHFQDLEFIRKQLLILQKMVMDLENKSLDLPIVDGSISLKIDREKTLSLKL